MIPTRIFVFFVFYLCSIFTIISTDHFATYIPGDVRHTECTDMPYMDYTITRSHLTCSSWCSSKSDCIRYMFCNSKNTNGGGCYLFGTEQDCLSTSPGHSCLCRIKKVVQDATTGVCKCHDGFYGTCCESIVQDCLHSRNLNLSGKMIMVQPSLATKPFEVVCLSNGNIIGTVITYRRHSSCNFFNQTWEMYSNGFGTLETGYWLGLERLYHLLNIPGRVQKLQIHIVAASGSNCANIYKGLQMSNESNNFTITLGNFAPVAGKPFCSDSIKTGSLASTGRPFSTYDHYSGSYDCPNKMKSGWWFADDTKCTATNLNGPFQSTFPHVSYDPDFANENITKMYIMYLQTSP